MTPASPDFVAEAEKRLLESAAAGGLITVLTGAGVSAESGIPTFRGKDGFWTVGSQEYQPQQMATQAMFSRDPEAVWSWYLYRMGLCRAAQPNAGHRALAAMEGVLGDRFLLITQNVDNLHLRAGSSPGRTLQIHGNLFTVRCAAGCTSDLSPLPSCLDPKAKGQPLSPAERRHLTCPACGHWLRPHVLWFDETYTEEHYRFDSALAAARRTRLLITVGTTGATTLPNHVVSLVHAGGGFMIDINVADNPFAGVARQSKGGICIQSASSQPLARLAGALRSAHANL